MRDGLRNVVFQLAVRIAVAIVTVLTTGQAPQAAEPPGYWSCNGTEWVAVGSPAHPVPLVPCGGPIVTDQVGITPEQCVARGGIWGPIGLFPEPICSERTLDAGRICADMGECAASCDANLTKEQYQDMLDGKEVLTGGFCSGSTPVIGCHATVVAGKLEGSPLYRLTR